ncbi:hypothetical protein EI94DRAFT_1707734 [Lactarius quietus]|nr:hypothetical protein EI94DRAFT_1707734 [Lactarius quietus]
MRTTCTPLPQPLATIVGNEDDGHRGSYIIQVVIGTGDPWVFLGQPVPVHLKTHTRDVGQGFSRVQSKPRHSLGLSPALLCLVSSLTGPRLAALAVVVIVAAFEVAGATHWRYTESIWIQDVNDCEDGHRARINLTDQDRNEHVITYRIQ